MILEVAILDIKPGQEAAFERDFTIASAYISSIDGYVSHQLQRSIETKSRYILLARWKTLEAHTEGFRKSPQYFDYNVALGSIPTRQVNARLSPDMDLVTARLAVPIR